MTVSALQLLHDVLNDDLDAAIRAGLMDYIPLPEHTELDPRLPQRLVQAQQQLQRAWAARQRYQARQARLQRLAQARLEKRTPSISTVTAKPALPAAALHALLRAKQRAAVSS